MLGHSGGHSSLYLLCAPPDIGTEVLDNPRNPSEYATWLPKDTRKRHVYPLPNLP